MKMLFDGTLVPDEDDPPTFVNAIHAAGRVVKAAASGQTITVSDEEKERRLAICKGCEFFNGKRCLKCKCFVRFKTKLATEHCPIGKW